MVNQLQFLSVINQDNKAFMVNDENELCFMSKMCLMKLILQEMATTNEPESSLWFHLWEKYCVIFF